VRDDWIMLSEAAALLRKSYNQTFRLLLIGKIRGTRLGGRWLLDHQAVEAMASQSESDTCPAGGRRGEQAR
jgi:excisionase family DNA binding protein